MRDAGVTFASEPRDEAYGHIAVFLDLAGNRWDLLGPRPASRADFAPLRRIPKVGDAGLEPDPASWPQLVLAC
jgi:hypothetical protein